MKKLPIWVLFIGLLLAACIQGPVVDTPVQQPPSSARPTATPTRSGSPTQPLPTPTHPGPARIVTVASAKAVSANQCVAEATDYFDPSDIFWISVRVKNLGRSDRVTAVFFEDTYGGSRRLQPQGGDLSTYGIRGGYTGCLAFGLRPSGKWVPGKYHVEIYLNGKFQMHDRFVVSGPVPPPPPPSPRCHPSYPDVCIPIGSADYDCAGGSGDGPNYIRGPIRVLWNVPNPDPYGLDRNRDGVGCERG